MLKCACCGCETVGEEYDICRVCGWEKDNVQEKFVGFAGGANKPSLAEAREMYRRCGSIDGKTIKTKKRPE